MGCPNTKECKVNKDHKKVIDIDFMDWNDGRSTLISDVRVTKNYVIKKMIGNGTFSDVFIAESKDTKLPYAIKCIKLRSLQCVESFVAETKALRNVNHPNIIKLHDVISTPLNAFIIMELATGGDLFERIRDHGGKLTITESGRVTKMIADALSYLHAHGVTHRDLKAENVLYYSPGTSRVVLSDFGFASLRGKDSVLSTFCGTMQYLSPELVSQKSYTSKVDVWALGCLVYFMVSGRLPWNNGDLRDKITNTAHVYNGEVWQNVPDEVKDFIDSCLVKDADARGTSKQISQHVWINKQNKCHVSEHSTNHRRVSNGSRPRSIAVSNSNRNTKKSLLPPISLSPDDPSSLIARKRFKGDVINSMMSPHTGAMTSSYSVNNNFVPSPKEVIGAAQVNTRSEIASHTRIFVEPKASSNDKIAFSSPSVILPKQPFDQIITKEDLLSISSSSTAMTSHREDGGNSMTSALNLMPPSHVTALSVISGCVSDNDGFEDDGDQQMDISTSHIDEINKESKLVSLNHSSVSHTLPPIKCNGLFTPRGFENYGNCGVTVLTTNADGLGGSRPRLDELFTPSNLKQNTGLLRRSRSSSPVHSMRTATLPTNFFTKDLNKVQHWLTQICEDTNKQRNCPRSSEPDHPRFCKLCVEGKSLAKSF